LKKSISLDETGLKDKLGNPVTWYLVWRVLIRFVAPAAILAVIIAVILGKDFS
jgi:hypothetical protein